MKILITGGAGFIGSHAAHYFRDVGLDVSILDNLSTGNIDNIKDIKLNYADICDNTVISAIKYTDVVLNLAAVVSVKKSIQDPIETERVNVSGLINLLECAGKCGVKMFIHASSAAVYGENGLPFQGEDYSPCEPLSPYGVSKLTGEYWVRYFAKRYGFTGINCRFFNVFGPRQSMEYSAVIPNFITKALRGEDLIINGDGNQTRDFIYVGDLVEAILCLIHYQDDLNYDTFNICSGYKITINELAKIILNKTNSKSRVIYAEPNTGDVRNSCGHDGRIGYYGFSIKEGDFEKGIEQTIKYYFDKILDK